MNLTDRYITRLVALRDRISAVLPNTQEGFELQVELDTLVEDLSERHAAEKERLNIATRRRQAQRRQA